MLRFRTQPIATHADCVILPSRSQKGDPRHGPPTASRFVREENTSEPGSRLPAVRAVIGAFLFTPQLYVSAHVLVKIFLLEFTRALTYSKNHGTEEEKSLCCFAGTQGRPKGRPRQSRQHDSRTAKRERQKCCDGAVEENQEDRRNRGRGGQWLKERQR